MSLDVSIDSFNGIESSMLKKYLQVSVTRKDEKNCLTALLAALWILPV